MTTCFSYSVSMNVSTGGHLTSKFSMKETKHFFIFLMVPPILGNLHEKIFLTGAYSVGDWCLSLAKVYMQMLSGHTSPSGTASAITGPLCAPSFIRFKGAPRGQSRQEDTRSATNVNSEACKISQIRISRPFYLIHPHSSSLPF